MNYKQLSKIFPNEKKAVKMLEEIIWHGQPVCPYCKSQNFTAVRDSDRYHCNTCNTSYTVTVNTVFHKTKIPLVKWYYIIYLKETGGLNIPLRTLGDEMGVTKDTANRIVNKVNNFYSQNRDLFNSIYSKISTNE